METIADLTKSFTESNPLEELCKKQTESLMQAKKLILKLAEEVKFLKAQLETIDSTDVLPKSTEQYICELQIEKLRDVALERSLTLEETKRLDLLVKNLLLSKGAYKDIKADYRTIPKGLTSDKLLEIASTNIENV